MKYVPLNFALMRHPVNWFIVLSVVLAGGALADILLRHFHAKGDTSNAP